MAYALVPLVDTETKLFPPPTMAALQQALAEGSVDPELLQQLVTEAVAQATSSGGAIHLGTGTPPDLIPGAKVGDVYVDTTTGNYYRLEAGA